MKKIVIFGTGRLYKKKKKDFKNDTSVVAFIDNDSSKWGMYLDGITVYPPDMLLSLEYDYVFILSKYCMEIRSQLIELGIDMMKVVDIYQGELLYKTGGIESHVFAESQRGQSKSVLFFSHELSVSGACLVLYQAAKLYKNKGYSVCVISRENGRLLKSYEESGISVIVDPDILYYDDCWRDLACKAELIIVNTFCFFYFLMAVSSEVKAKTIWWIHESFFFQSVSSEQFNICVRNIGGVAAVSHLILRKIRESYGYEKGFVLSWGIPDENIIPKRKNNERLIFAIVGSIDNMIKGHDVFLKAIDNLSDEDRENSEFWIVGAGDINETEVDIVKKYSCIKQIGFVEQNKIPELYSMIDVVICASRQEAMSIAVVEAFMNRKLAVVSDAAGIIDYMISNEDGMIFPSGDYERLAELFHWILTHKDRAEEMGRCSRRVYDQLFTIESFERRLMMLLKHNEY